MRIAYTDPFSRAWRRMTKALFKPFDIKKWFVVGFTAFLAGLMDCHNGGGNGGGRGGGHVDFGDVLDFPRTAWEWLLDHPGWFTLILFGLLFAVALGILLTWLSSRGKFMFLDNVVHDRAQVVNPWRQFRMEGNSLFLFRLLFGFICLALVIVFVVLGFRIASDIYYGDLTSAAAIITIVGIALVALAAFVIVAYIGLFLESFVIPIMYKNNMRIVEAWGLFLPLFSGHFLHFIVYGLFVLLLYILAVICVIIFCVCTCCIGGLLMIIPYIGSVVTLPISYTFRAFSVEFLEQFGTEFKLFPESEEQPVGSPA